VKDQRPPTHLKVLVYKSLEPGTGRQTAARGQALWLYQITLLEQISLSRTKLPLPTPVITGQQIAARALAGSHSVYFGYI
jgi:hypothetical protein